MNKMGAKMPIRPKTRRPTCKCDICDCTFINVQELRTHQACVHTKTKRVAYKPKVEVLAKRKEIPLRKCNILSTKRGKLSKVFKEPSPEPVCDEETTIESGFECPVCSKWYKMYFSAMRHIKKHHCINDKGEPVPPNFKSLIKPLIVEQCLICFERIKDANEEKHRCMELTTLNDMKVHRCHGCNQTFKTKNAFEKHIPHWHSNESVNLFFADISMFTSWKHDMESVMESKYQVTKDKGRQVFRCSNITSTEPIKCCPSSINTQIFSNGIQVLFYKKHHGHKTKDYVLPDSYKKYRVNVCLRQPRNKTETENVETVYSEFKNVMEDIINEADNSDVANVKVLLGKAYEMSVTLNKLNIKTKKALTDKEISDLVNESDSKINTDAEEVEAKRVKIEQDANSNDSTVNSENGNIFYSPSSFNESYKNFVDSTVKIEEMPRTKRKEPLKTRMGEFKANESTLKKEIKRETNLPPKVDIKYEVLERENDCNILIIKI